MTQNNVNGYEAAATMWRKNFEASSKNSNIDTFVNKTLNSELP